MPPPADDDANGGANGAAPLHLLKMAVGIGDVEELRRFRAERLKERGASWVYTRNRPRRAEEVLAGGSIYWVIRGQVRVRQLVTGFRAGRDDNGRTYCLIKVDPDLVETLWRPWRPFQGWRYLSPADAPPDRPGGMASGEATIPAAMLAELRALGLI
jgi:hypothetical protein